MSKTKILKLLVNPYTLLVVWSAFLLSPLLGILRMTYIENNSVTLQISGASTFLYYLPYLITFVAVVILGIWVREFMEQRLVRKHVIIFFFISILSIIFVIVTQDLMIVPKTTYGALAKIPTKGSSKVKNPYVRNPGLLEIVLEKYTQE